MTTIVYRAGRMVADSRETIEHPDRGVYNQQCCKLFSYDNDRYIIGLEGESSPGMVFLEWFASFQGMPTKGQVCRKLVDSDADFTALVLCKKGLFEFDKWCLPTRILSEFHAIGSGAKAALGALHLGATARQAVEIACKVDPYSGAPIVEMKL